MEEELTKEMAKELMKIEGETRGFNLEHDIKWILREKGREGLEKVKEETKRVGFPIQYENIKTMGFYPAGLRVISLLAIKKAFDMEEGGIREVCALHPKVSLVMRLFAKYFYSIPEVMKNASRMWSEYWTTGELIPLDYDEEKKYAVVRIKDFDLHPVFCRCLEGYFRTVATMVTGSENVSCKETECTFRGDKYHDYRVEWE